MPDPTTPTIAQDYVIQVNLTTANPTILSQPADNSTPDCQVLAPGRVQVQSFDWAAHHQNRWGDWGYRWAYYEFLRLLRKTYNRVHKLPDGFMEKEDYPARQATLAGQRLGAAACLSTHQSDGIKENGQDSFSHERSAGFGASLPSGRPA